MDVGQGDSVLIESANGRNILIDGGPDKKVLRRLSEQLELGERTLDLVVLTHPHADHVTGLNAVLEHYRVDRILLPPARSQTPAFKYFLDRARKNKVPVSRITAPFQAQISPQCRLNFLYPRQERKFNNLNNASLVSRLKCSDLSFLFTGDIEAEVEKKIMSEEVELDSDVLKVAHHGSADSSIGKFLEEVSPELAVISAGKDNELGHPSLRTVKKLKRTGAEILRTDRSGTITIEKREDKWAVSPENK